MRRALKYLLVVLVNMLILIGMVYFWNDALVKTITKWSISNEIFKIIGFSILALIGIRILVFFFRKRGIVSVKQKIKVVVVFTVILSLWLYVDYIAKIVNNRILNPKLRKELSEKLIVNKPKRAILIFSKELTAKEYRQISMTIDFPKIPRNAELVSFNYYNSSSLQGDYSISVSYNLPLNKKIEEFDFKDGDFWRSQTVEKLINKQRVNYEEVWF